MARPAPNNPQGSNGYGDDGDEAEGERIMSSTPKRSAPEQQAKAAKARQWHGDVPPEARPESAWNDNDAEPVAMDYDAAPVPSGEPGPSPQPRSGKSERVPNAVQPSSSSESPVEAEALDDSPHPDLAAEPAPPESVAPKARRRAPPRDYDWAGAIYLALMALLVACLSAAVVLFLF